MKGILLNSDTLDIQVTPARDGNGMITTGMVLGNNDYQRCHLIIIAQKGEFKEYPALGFGIDSYLKSVDNQNHSLFVAAMTKELKSDGLSPRITVGDKLSKFDIEL